MNISLSGPMELDLDIYRGDTGSFRVTVNDGAVPTPGPVDLTGAEWDADIRTTAVSPTVVAQFQIVPVDGDTSSIDVVLDETNADLLIAGDLVYDIEMRLNGAVVTLVKGAIVVTQDVSRPT